MMEPAAAMADATAPADAYQVIVVGAGAAGLVAAMRAAERGRRTLLLEKNRKPGVKILMSGGTRCNITQATDNRGIIAQFGPAGRFLHSALASFGVEETLALFAKEGVPTKVEPTGKIFPQSDKALDVLAALLRRFERSGAQMALSEPLVTLVRDEQVFLLSTALRQLRAERVILTTGGCSYPGSGTSGDGYAVAASFGHTIIKPRPALVPLVIDVPWLRGLSGMTLSDVALRVVELPLASSGSVSPAAEPGKASTKPRVLTTRRGSFLFTHFGLSGPVVLDVSREVSDYVPLGRLRLVCDFLPHLEQAILETELQNIARAGGKKQLLVALADWSPEWLPRRLADALLAELQIPAERKLAEVSKRDWARLVGMLKHCELPVHGTRGFAKAEVTAGGVALDEVDSRDLQSKLVPGLHFAGEVLDLDGPIGGYNFQAAWSTGWLAGESV